MVVVVRPEETRGYDDPESSTVESRLSRVSAWWTLVRRETRKEERSNWKRPGSLLSPVLSNSACGTGVTVSSSLVYVPVSSKFTTKAY